MQDEAEGSLVGDLRTGVVAHDAGRREITGANVAQRRGVVFSNEVGLSGLPTRASDADNSCEMAESELAK